MIELHHVQCMVDERQAQAELNSLDIYYQKSRYALLNSASIALSLPRRLLRITTCKKVDEG